MTLAMRIILVLTLMLPTIGATLAQQTATSATTKPQAPTTTGTSGATATASTTTAAAAAESDEPPTAQSALKTRDRFTRLVNQHPPEVAAILALDPTLLSNEPFLARYPEIAQFLAEHPEVRRNPHYYVRDFGNPTERHERSPWEGVLEAISIGFVLSLIAFALAWLVRTVIEQRRWTRLSQTQSEVHNKIMDRFGSSEELLAYMKTPAGSRFLESAPIPLHSEPARPNTPMTRVLWSIQIGMVLAAAGVGMLLVSGRFARPGAEGFFAMGAIAFCIGAGFIASAIVSLILSRRLGIWPERPARTPGDDSGLVR